MLVRVSSPSHVYAGVVDLHGGLGRACGLLGFALQEPRVTVEAKNAPGGLVVEDPRGDGDTRAYTEAACRLYGCKGALITVLEAPPRHAGLGSTAHLALSIAWAVAALHGRRFNPAEAAASLGLGFRAGMAVNAFAYGGFIVEGGFPSTDTGRGVPPLVYRGVVPRSWRVVAVLLSRPLQGAGSRAPLRQLDCTRRPLEGEGEACMNARLVLMGILPAASEGDWAKASALLQELNDHMRSRLALGGSERYCCGEAEAIADALRAAGAPCACQSGPGPLVYSLTPAKEARRLLTVARRALREAGGGTAWVTGVNNRGAYLTVTR